MSERKPKMNEHRRKVLNLLEYILESDPYWSGVTDLIKGVTFTAKDLSDKELADALQEYANGLVKAGINRRP